jgi:hypothetical protein
MEDIWVHRRLLMPYLRTRVTLFDDRIACFMPETVFDLIPIGNQTITQLLTGVEHVSVETKVEGPRFLMGELFVMLGILLFLGDGLGILPILATLIGMALSLDSIRAQLVIFDASGSELMVPMSNLDRKAALNFARTVNTIVVSRAHMAGQRETGTKLGVVLNMSIAPVLDPPVSYFDNVS